MIFRILPFIFSFFLISISSFAESKSAYHIEVTIDDFQEKELYLAYYLGDKQYIKDTVAISSNGKFIFEGEETLDGGIYLVILPPDNNFFQVLIDEKEQNFSIHTKANDPSGSISFKGSPSNELFIQYMQFLSGKRITANKLNEDLTLAEGDETKTKKIKNQLEKINDEVKNYQTDFVQKNPNSVASVIVKSSLEVKVPEFSGDDKEKQFQRWQFSKNHWFDNMDLADERLLRSPMLFNRIDQYMTNMTIQHPDSLSVSIDQILLRMKPNDETFKFYLVHFLNKYAKSKIVGMDAVYVHLVENYYAKGLASWTDEDQLIKIIDNAKTLKPLLIGKIAPNIKMEKMDKSPIALHDIKSDYTVLFFWDPECGHCKKSMPEVVKFQEDFKDKGVVLFAVCTKFQDGITSCWETIEERKMTGFLNVVDPFHRSRYKKLYDIRSTPQIYILDKNKKIISKRIGAEQLEKVLNQIIEVDAKDKN